MNYIASGISFAVWSGVTAGMGATFLFSNISFMRAAAIGGGSVTASVAALGIAYLCVTSHGKRNSSYYEYRRDDNFLGNWSWVGIVPMVAIPYFSGVSAAAGVTLVALGILGGVAKAYTVGILP